jgi:hypothetical protein
MISLGQTTEYRTAGHGWHSDTFSGTNTLRCRMFHCRGTRSWHIRRLHCLSLWHWIFFRLMHDGERIAHVPLRFRLFQASDRLDAQVLPAHVPGHHRPFRCLQLGIRQAAEADPHSNQQRHSPTQQHFLTPFMSVHSAQSPLLSFLNRHYPNYNECFSECIVFSSILSIGTLKSFLFDFISKDTKKQQVSGLNS